MSYNETKRTAVETVKLTVTMARVVRTYDNGICIMTEELPMTEYTGETGNMTVAVELGMGVLRLLDGEAQ